MTRLASNSYLKDPVGFLLVITSLLVSWPAALLAQEEPQLQLRLSRDFGYSAGGQIQGTFSFRIEGPTDLTRVVFQIDGEPVGEVREAPFRLRFNTGDYSPGRHTMSAIGYRAHGEELRSNEITRVFVTGATARQSTVRTLIVVGVLIIGGRLLSSWIANRGNKTGKPVVSGPLGGTLCPKCGRPFAIHLWSFKLLVTRLDRCPHCGKWSFVNRVQPEILQAAAESFDKTDEPSTHPEVDSEEERRRRLEDSRFDDYSSP